MLIATYENSTICYEFGLYFVYGRFNSGDPVITDSLDYAHDVAASC